MTRAAWAGPEPGQDDNAFGRICPDWYRRMQDAMTAAGYKDLQKYAKSVVGEAYGYDDGYAHRYLHKCDDWTACREHEQCAYGTNMEFCEECREFHRRMGVMAAEEDERDDLQIVLVAREFATHFARVHEFMGPNR